MTERVLVTGSREWTNITVIKLAICRVVDERGVEVVIHGACRGADRIAGVVARRMGIAVEPYPAKWKVYGNAAGPIRNRQMLREGKPTLVLAFHNSIDTSTGTRDMLEIADAAGVPWRGYTSRGESFGPEQPSLFG